MDQLLHVPRSGETAQFLWDCHPNAVGTHGHALYVDWTHTIERKENVGVLVWHSPPPIHLLMPESTTAAGQHVRFTPPEQIPKATATLPSKDQATRIILTEGDFPIQDPTKYLSF